MNNSGQDKLWCWFGLSYASFLTIPRVLMHEMPDEWQGKMADLLDELDEEFFNAPNFKYRVQRVEGNKLAKFPEWLLNYRHPNQKQINLCRVQSGGEVATAYDNQPKRIKTD